MNINPLILSALSPLGFPISWLEYKGKAKEYIVFNDSLNAPAVYADDTDTAYTIRTQIHFYTPNDPTETLSRIRKALRSADFTILETVVMRDNISGQQTGLIHGIVKVQYKMQNEEES